MPSDWTATPDPQTENGKLMSVPPLDVLMKRAQDTINACDHNLGILRAEIHEQTLAKRGAEAAIKAMEQPTPNPLASIPA